MQKFSSISNHNNQKSSASIFNQNKQSSFFKPVIQPKPASTAGRLTTNQPNDIYEREADVMAEKVMRMTESQSDAFFKPQPVTRVQRKCAECEEEKEQELQRKQNNAQTPEVNSRLENYVNGLGNSGTPLPQKARNFFEPRMGYDFSNVRVHSDSKAAKSAQSINALAFTSGNNLVFNKDEYSFNTDKGKRLLAHELTHIAQQNQTGWHIRGQTTDYKPSVHVMRKERDPAPAINPEEPAMSWFYADDPTGHVASIYFDTASSILDVDDQAVLYQVNLILEDSNPPSKMMFEGYSDTAGDPISNRALSERRAMAVAASFPLPTMHTKVNFTGLGEQGPEPATDNATQLSHYRRVDVIVMPPRPTTRYEPPKYDGGQYGSPKLKLEVQRATDALDATLLSLYHAIVGGVPTPGTSAALERYFPHTRYRSAEFISTLAGEISHIRARINSINYMEIKDPNEIYLNCRTSQWGPVGNWDDNLCKAIWNAMYNTPKIVAFPSPKDSPNKIVLTPPWYHMPDPASVLVHETAHMLLGLRGHPTDVPHRDPYAIQGFIAALGSLTAAESDERYPAP